MQQQEQTARKWRHFITSTPALQGRQNFKSGNKQQGQHETTLCKPLLARKDRAKHSKQECMHIYKSVTAVPHG